MSLLHSITSGITGIGGKAIHGAEDLGKKVGKGVTQGADAVADAAKKAADETKYIEKAVAHGATVVTTAAGNVVVGGAKTIESDVTSAADKVAHGASGAFQDAVHSGEDAFNALKADIEKGLEEIEIKLLGEYAKKILHELDSDIKAIIGTFREVESAMKGDINAIRDSAKSRMVTPAARNAIRRLTAELAPEIAGFMKKDYVSFGLEFGASASLGVAGEVGLGLLAGLPNVTDVRGYGSVGVTAGVEEGAEGGVSLVFSTSAPEDSDGPSINIVFSLDVEAGGTVVVSFNVPDFSLGGISIGVEGGEEVGVSAGGGYTFVF